MRSASSLFVVILGLVAFAPAASAQSKPPAKPAPKPPASKPAASPANSGKADAKPATDAASALATLQFAATDLPEGLTSSAEVKCISIQAQNYYRDPGFAKPMVPTPTGKAGQCISKGKDTLGSIMAFEFAEEVSKDTRGFLTSFIWGEDHATGQHPEQILISGRYVVILSFPLGDAQEAWFEARLKERLAKLGPHDWSSLLPVIKEALADQQKQDPAAGLKLLKDHADEIRDYAFAQYMQGELAADAKQWGLAESSYSRAIELNDSGADPLPTPPRILWASLDGLAGALLYENKVEQAVTVFERAVPLIREIGDNQQLATCLYNYACALSRAGRFEDSLKALTEAIQLKPEHKAMAAKDSDFAKARERPDFKKLLAD